MRIRAATQADVTDLARLAAESYRAAFQPILGEEGLALRGETFFQERFDREWPTLRLAEKEGILGFHQTTGGRLDMLFLDPLRRGEGIGARLLADAESLGAAELECFRDNRGARRFYERHGWSLSAAHRRDFAGAERDFVIYTKP